MDVYFRFPANDGIPRSAMECLPRFQRSSEPQCLLPGNLKQLFGGRGLLDEVFRASAGLPVGLRTARDREYFSQVSDVLVKQTTVQPDSAISVRMNTVPRPRKNTVIGMGAAEI
jgi:hypothetical protein